VTTVSQDLDESAADASAVAAPSVPSGDLHRYPGAPPFGDSEVDRLLFRGRTREIDAVLHSILSHDLLVVYALSGTGKTSLLNAGVFEPLRQRDYFPIIVRLNNPGTPIVQSIAAQIGEAGEASPGIAITRNPGEQGSTDEPSTLWDLLAGMQVWRGNVLLRAVLVFDQFEELFTLGWSDTERDRFIKDFGQIVRRYRAEPDADDPSRPAPLPPPDVKITLSIREDFLGHLEELAVDVPQILHHRFRLEGLSVDQATAAINEPAAIDDPRLTTRRFSYRPDAIGAILTFLRTKDERGKQTLARTVDPSQLQIICQHIERAILPAKSAPDGQDVEISAADLGGTLGLQRIVGDFYRRQIELFPRRQRKAVRRFCERGLISERGRRLSLEEGEITEHYGVTKEILAVLVDRRLLRAEPRVGSVYYELAHDTLTSPIVAYRDDKRRAARRHRVVLGGLAVLALAVVIAIKVGISFGRESSTVQRINPGDTVTGQLVADGDVAEFVFETPTDVAMVVEVQPGDALDATLAISGPGLELPLWANDTGKGESESLIVGGGSGQWRATVSGFTAGTFELEVRPVDATLITIDDQPMLGSLLPGEVAVYEFDLSDDSLVSITVDSNDFDVVLEAITPTGYRPSSDVDTGADSSSLPPVPREADVADSPVESRPRSVPTGDVDTEAVMVGGVPGRYWALIYGSWRAVASGDIRQAPSDFRIDVGPTDVARVVGETASGSLDASGDDVDVFEFDLPDDSSVGVVVDPDDQLDPTVGIIGPSGSIVVAGEQAEGDPDPSSSTPGQPERAVVGGAAGAYRVVVSGASGSGSFELTVHPAEVVAVGETASGSVNSSADIDVFDIELSDDVSVDVVVEPDAQLDPKVEIIKPSGSPVLSDCQASGGSEHAELVGGGTYRVVVSAASGSGGFELTVRPAEVVVSYEFGEAVRESLADCSDTAVFRFHAPSGRALMVRVDPEGDDLDAGLELTAPNGETKVFDDGQHGAAETAWIDAGPGGLYQASVRGYWKSIGEFTFAALQIEELEVGEQASAELGDPGVGVYEFEADADRTYVVEATPAESLDVEMESTDVKDQASSTDNLSAGGVEIVRIHSVRRYVVHVVVNSVSSTSGTNVVSVREVNVPVLTPPGSVTASTEGGLLGPSLACSPTTGCPASATMSPTPPTSPAVPASTAFAGLEQRSPECGAEASGAILLSSTPTSTRRNRTLCG
jgi:hypothetical protein